MTDHTDDRLDPSRHSDTFEALARRCEQGAQALEYEAEHAAEILPTRAGGDRADPQQWAQQKRAAAQAARDYAASLRADAGDRPYARMSPDRLAQADQVASAANLGGILIDGRRTAERAADAADGWAGEADKQAWEAGTHPAQRRAAEVEATGVFGHVAETIDGREQVPFWLLGQTDTDTTGRARADRRADEDEA